MPYSITTKDGITIQNIPDDVPADAPELRERVAKIRAGSGTLEAQPDGFGARLDREIRDIPRQVGLTARHGIEGATEALGVFSEPIRQGLNLIPGVNLPTAAQGGRSLADTLRLPKPQNAQERVVGDAARLMAGVATFGGAGNAIKTGATGVTRAVAEQVAANPAQQIIGAGSGGAAGGYTRETGGGTGAQIAASLAGGVTGAAATAGAQRLSGALGGLVEQLRRGRVSQAEVTVTLDGILSANGIKTGQIPMEVRGELAREVKRALDTGKPLDPVVVRRIADYGVVGATPTRGAVTLDPVAITQERNLAKIGANSSDPRLQQLAQLQRANDMKLTENLNALGAGGAVEPTAAGTQLLNALRATDAPRKQAVDAAYKAVKDSSGRYANIDVPAFSSRANAVLDEEMLGSVLPEKARALLNDVSTGKLPLNVNTAVQLDKRLSGLVADAASSGDRQGALAINTIRRALSEAPIESTSGADAMRLYEHARGMAAQRFAAIDKSPAMAAALDDVAPDRFVQTFILGQGGKANARDVLNLARDLKQHPEAFQAARQQIVSHLKGKALSGAADEVGNFSPSAYNKALQAIGSDKLKMFFKPDELAQLRAVGRVASYEKFQPSGSAVNNSNTASTFAGLMERIAESPMVSKIPFGRQAIADPAASWVASIRSKEALAPMNALLAREPSIPRPANSLFPAAALPLLVQKRD